MVYRPLRVWDGQDWIVAADPRVTSLAARVAAVEHGGGGGRGIAGIEHDPQTGDLTVVFTDATTAGPFPVRGPAGARGTRVTMLSTPPPDALPGDINIDPATGVPSVFADGPQ